MNIPKICNGIGKDVADQLTLGVIPAREEAIFAAIVDSLCTELHANKPYIRPQLDHFSILVGRTLEAAARHKGQSPLVENPLLKERPEDE